MRTDIRLHSQRGGALFFVLALMILLTGAAMVAVNTANIDMDLSFNQLNSDKAFYIAQSGIEHATAMLGQDRTWRTGFAERSFGGGTYTVTLLDSTVRPNLAETLLVSAVGTEGEARSYLELMLVEATYHPLYNHAIYAGNYTEYDPDADPQTWNAEMTFSGTGSDADCVNGDVFFNGNLNVEGDASIDGEAFAGGDFDGNTPTDGVTTGKDYLAPPDLLAQNYESEADFIIGSGSTFDSYGRLPSWDPRHIFVKDYRSDLAATAGYNFDNTNYFFGDPWERSDLSRVSVSADGNKSVYFVDGNLWIEPGGTVQSLVNGPPGGTQITVVVKGNIYFSDNLDYQNDELDGLAFIAMTDGESYTDENGNSQYDPGEPILHDNGNGSYDGPAEGSGNIRFGDPNGGPLGDINGFLYAENNFEDYVLDGPDGTPQDFSVNGLLSAGNRMDINRNHSGGHSRMCVTYDDRLQRGELDLPGLPKLSSTEYDGWVKVAWKEL